jgi:hypothetical protein
MSQPVIRIVLDLPTGQYQPGDRLSGRFLVEGTLMRIVRAAELSVLWYTAGKGEEDMAVHHFERLVDDVAKPLDLRVPQRFATVLPQSPLSYDGEIVKVCWCVRLRLFFPQVQESVTEMPFRLGHVSQAVAVPAADEVPDTDDTATT